MQTYEYIDDSMMKLVVMMIFNMDDIYIYIYIINVKHTNVLWMFRTQHQENMNIV